MNIINYDSCKSFIKKPFNIAVQRFERAKHHTTWKGRTVEVLWAIGNSIPLVNYVITALDRFFNENIALVRVNDILGSNRIFVPKFDECIDEDLLLKSIKNRDCCFVEKKKEFRTIINTLIKKMTCPFMWAFDRAGNAVLLINRQETRDCDTFYKCQDTFSIVFSSGTTINAIYSCEVSPDNIDEYERLRDKPFIERNSRFAPENLITRTQRFGAATGNYTRDHRFFIIRDFHDETLEFSELLRAKQFKAKKGELPILLYRVLEARSNRFSNTSSRNMIPLITQYLHA